MFGFQVIHLSVSLNGNHVCKEHGAQEAQPPQG